MPQVQMWVALSLPIALTLSTEAMSTDITVVHMALFDPIRWESYLQHTAAKFSGHRRGSVGLCFKRNFHWTLAFNHRELHICCVLEECERSLSSPYKIQMKLNRKATTPTLNSLFYVHIFLKIEVSWSNHWKARIEQEILCASWCQFRMRLALI